MERQVIRYVNNVIYVSDACCIWKDAYVFDSSSMGNDKNIVFRCVASTVFNWTCRYGTRDICISNFSSGWNLFIILFA